MKKLFIDFETTGTDSNKHAPWQCSGYIVIGDEKKSEFNLLFKPDASAEIDLDNDKYRPDLVANASMTSYTAYKKFIAILKTWVNPYDKKDKFMFIAYNASFDFNFLHRWASLSGDPYIGSFVWFPPICAAQKAFDIIGDNRPSLTNFKLSTLCKYFNIDVQEDKLHDAMYDVELTYQLFNKLEESKNG